MNKTSTRRGATMVEYALLLAIFALVFVFASKKLKESTSIRYDRAINPLGNMAPCGKLGTSAGLGGDECL